MRATWPLNFSSSGRAVGGLGDEMLGCAPHREEEKMNMVRRQFLHLAAASTAVFASPYVVRAQEQAPKIGLNPLPHHTLAQQFEGLR